MHRIARSDPVTRFTLLSIKGKGKSAGPILPVDPDSPDALQDSPLFTIIDPNLSEAELSETASNLMGPGPWTFHQDLRLPKSCDDMHFTNRNRRSNIIVSHMLKVVMRVERGDDVHMDAKTGKRKLFDIVVQTPVLILSVSPFIFLSYLSVRFLTKIACPSVVVIQNGHPFHATLKHSTIQRSSFRTALAKSSAIASLPSHLLTSAVSQQPSSALLRATLPTLPMHRLQRQVWSIHDLRCR